MNRINLGIGLKILALIFWWFILLFILNVIALYDSRLQQFLPEIRQPKYQWDYELMFAAFFAVWGIYLWKIAKNPFKHLTFVSFTIWANIVHGVVMVIIGVIRSSEFWHLFSDGLIFILPALFVMYLRDKKILKQMDAKTYL